MFIRDYRAILAHIIQNPGILKGCAAHQISQNSDFSRYFWYIQPKSRPTRRVRTLEIEVAPVRRSLVHFKKSEKKMIFS